ncbi:MAG: FAD/NAD(P)-binding protein [Desulfarculaceae bacterium]|nr:FAD/NAD(P)-binding protein [Desulfarculaceae bacterium]MCF8073126.1 FAD/NAD(P)-binding protein [Desulfarculaceae bacterium]MCF8101789.1 FAD/NAD(P)-binding protein [Desulfarculaceae bacterium]MCF8117353.1 FAD/NAD(P)-binding protein [Desulfarculaceae bacterium]
MRNTYVPYPVRIKKAEVATEDKQLKTFLLEFINEQEGEDFNYIPGQFAELSVSGYGEIPIGIASSPTEGNDLLFTVNKVGSVSTQLHNMNEGDIMGVRGPLGNSYPLSEMEGKNIVIVAGGFAVTTLRSTMIWLLDPANRSKYGDITFIYGARTPGLLLYEEEWRQWRESGQANVNITIDREAEGWDGLVGFVPTVCEEVAPKPDNAVALICGPPVMIRFTQPVFDKLGWQPEQIVMSLENRMKCGIGICGRCNVGPEYVCKDGPVFTKAHLDQLPKEY